MRVGQRHGHRGVAILLGIFLSVLSAAVPVRALECVPPETLLDRYAVIVEGRIRHIRPARMQNQLPGSQPQWVVLTVIRYYKGEGEAEFRFLFDGLGWAALPDVGSEIIVGLMHSPNVGYTAGPCSLLIPSVPTQAREAELHTQVRERFGPGVAPPLSQPSIRPFPLWGLFPLLGGCLLFLACRKKRKSAAHT